MRIFYIQTPFVVVLLMSCTKVLQGANKVEMELDLVSGRVVPPTVPGVLTHITLLDGPTASSRPDQCDGQALVRLDFSGSYKKAKIELFYGREPRLWTATIADSPKSYGFGANHEYSSNCAEAQVFNGQLRLYSNLLPGFLRESMDGHSLMRVTDKAVEMGANMTFELSDGSVSWKTHFPNTSEVLKDSIRNCPFLFTLSGQIPAFGPPRDSYIYAGFNRVPLGSFHSGSGLCKVRITFKREQDPRCAAGRHDCHKNAKCRSTKHSYKCICKPGYAGNGKKCKKLDACSIKNGGCEHLCHEEGGRFWCSCFEGHKLHPNMRNCIATDVVGAISKRIRVRLTQDLLCKIKQLKDQFLQELQKKLTSQEVCNFPCTIDKPFLRCRRMKKGEKKIVSANFEIQLDQRAIYASKFCNTSCTRCQMEERLQKFITVLRTMTDNESLNVTLNGQVIAFKEKSLRVTKESDRCKEKRTRKVKRLAARCQPGTFFDSFLRKCVNCSRGSYQPNRSETFCFRCPGNMTTHVSGAEHISECVETTCGGNFTSLSGVIKSPNYPDPYPQGTQCEWYIHCPKNRGLLMFIPNISLPLNVNCSDHLIMRENVSRYSRTTYYACESYDNPMAFISRSKHLYIKFSSKSGNEDAEGFKIFYVTFKEQYRNLVRSIVEDGDLYSNDSLRKILKDENLVTQILDIMAHPRKFFDVDVSAKTEIPEFYAFVENKFKNFIDTGAYDNRR